MFISLLCLKNKEIINYAYGFVHVYFKPKRPAINLAIKPYSTALSDMDESTANGIPASHASRMDGVNGIAPKKGISAASAALCAPPRLKISVLTPQLGQQKYAMF